jgi:hypothetical protein
VDCSCVAISASPSWAAWKSSIGCPERSPLRGALERLLLDVADEILGDPYMPEVKPDLRRQPVESRVEPIWESFARSGCSPALLGRVVKTPVRVNCRSVG